MARTRRGTSRRTTRWITYTTTANALTSGTSEQTVIVAAANATTVGMTVLRVVGNIAFHGTTVDTANLYTSGLIVGPSTLDALDTDPSANPELDWMYWEARGTNNAAYDGVDSYVLDRHWIDVRGRRRLDEGESLLFCETMNGTGGNSYVNLRILVLNP